LITQTCASSWNLSHSDIGQLKSLVAGCICKLAVFYCLVNQNSQLKFSMLSHWLPVKLSQNGPLCSLHGVPGTRLAAVYQVISVNVCVSADAVSCGKCYSAVSVRSQHVHVCCYLLICFSWCCFSFRFLQTACWSPLSPTTIPR